MPVIAPDISSREGYRPDFLDLTNGKPVPLPVLTAAGKAAAVRLDDGSFELKYHKFSVVMHKRRRLALFTASNVDWRAESRKVDGSKPTRTALNAFTGNEREDCVTDSRFLHYQVPGFLPGRGPRQSPTSREMTSPPRENCLRRCRRATRHVPRQIAPQTAEFNRAAESNWGALEQMVQKQTAKEKVCIFSGPVLAEDDGYFHGLIKSRVPVSIQVPSKFWKIIVTNVDGEPASFGFVLDQDVSGLDLFTEMAVPDAWKKYLRPISEIEGYLNGLAKLTALKPGDQFGKV